MLKPPKPPSKPRKRKYETPEQHPKRFKEWDATKPPPLEVQGSGHHMTQDYYTSNILPSYIKWVHEACLREPRSSLLQEDNDPSHGTKSNDNVAQNLRVTNWIALIFHPGQSPDLNPIEGVWLILKQRAKRCIYYPEPCQRKWDGTKKHLKEILTGVWDSITVDEIRDRIAEMLERVKELRRNRGEKLRYETW